MGRIRNGLVRCARSLARHLLGVARVPTYYLPWLVRPGLTCALLLSNVEARFTTGSQAGPLTLSVRQHDADGAIVMSREIVLRTPTDAEEVPLEPTPDGAGFVTVDGKGLRSDLYVTLSDGNGYTATHGRQEFVELYPLRSRVLFRAAGGALALLGLTIPAFTRDQYVYAGADSRTYVLLMNLSNVTNRIRVTAEDAPTSRLLPIPPMGARLLDVAGLIGAPASAATGTRVLRLRLTGNAWFNLYLVGAGAHGLAGPLSLMHVK